jgi:hypothetical protein
MIEITVQQNKRTLVSDLIRGRVVRSRAATFCILNRTAALVSEKYLDVWRPILAVG